MTMTGIIPSVSQSSDIKPNLITQDVPQQVSDPSINDPYHQLEGFQLFAYFTALIIQEDVPFTR